MDTKLKIQKETRRLILENGYASITMNKIYSSLKISAGGLYYHYHSVEEILFDIIESETNDVWTIFDKVNTFEDFLESLNEYLKLEQKDLLDIDNSLNSILYQYYFSLNPKDRQKILKKSHTNVLNKIESLLSKVFLSREHIEVISNHLFVMLHGLTFLAMSGEINEEKINNEFEYTLEFICKLHRLEKLVQKN
ncbi:TetR/AcrR family transcriptional regulator [Clostridioides difficile]|nr:TetR/AcrR family transcriptional regulator [Clostridioides difficile]